MWIFYAFLEKNDHGWAQTFSINFKTCSNLYEPFGAHCTETLFGTYSSTILPTPLKTNSRFGDEAVLLDATDVITVILSWESEWFSLTPILYDEPLKFSLFCSDDWLRCNGIWSDMKISGSTT